ncbi:sidekick cell adhesion molecule isoform X3 [Musca autumnalis]|uniref:sidekick cell adhesion molecule isoform X3 n=1 Tax=Musca autumnalis TaxID=221902 RepID=UPI003CE90011
MEELERRLHSINPKLATEEQRVVHHLTINQKKQRISKIHLWITLAIFVLCQQINSCYSLDGQQLQPPRFTTQPSSSGSIVSEGRTKILQCHALGYPQPTYRWIKNGVPVGDFSPSQYMRILNTQRDDAGSYKCIAKNEAGSIFSETIDVVVAYMGTFNNVSEGRLNVISGHPAILDLPDIESVPVPSVIWQTVDGPLNYDIKYAFTKSNQLIILNTDEVDRQAYRARAINTQLGKEETSSFIHVNVSGDPYIEVPPEIIVHPQDMKLKRGEQVAELQCIANARPLHELETLWFKDGIPIENAEIAHTLNDPWNRSLALLSVNLTHSGEYSCQVRLRSGGYQTLVAKAKIEILEPPIFFTPMRQETFGDLGVLVSLPCDVVGDPQPSVTWFRNAEPIDLNNEKYSIAEDNALHIKKLELEDSAMYQCLAVNEAGEKSAYTWLRVKTIKLPYNNGGLVEEYSASITATTTTTTTNNHKISATNYKHKTTKFINHRFNIPHHGAAAAAANSTQSTTPATKAAKVQPNAAEDVIINGIDKAEFNSPDYEDMAAAAAQQHYRHHQPHRFNKHLKVYDVKSKVSSSVAANPTGNVNASSPIVSPIINNTTTTCTSINTHPLPTTTTASSSTATPTSITTTKDMVVGVLAGGNCAFVSDLLKRIKRLAQPRILRVKSSHAGATTGSGSGYNNNNNRRKDFRFASAPVMEVPPQNVTALDGKDATISCRAVGAPSPNITWIYNETQLVEISSRIQILESGDLLISNVRESDAGLYTCVRSNEAGTVNGEAYLGVLVRTQIIQPPVDTTVLLGLTASLQCKVSSDPTVPYNIDWYREGHPTPISNSQRIGVQSDGTLEIQAVRASDVGTYACVVTSPGGNETRSAHLSVIELPFPPANVKATRLDGPNQRAINVSWTPGFDGNSPISKFIIQRREVSELEKFVGPVPDPFLNWITELSNVSAENRWILLENLKAATVYQFRVSAVNQVGEGSPSEPSNVVELPQEAPSGPPVGFVGSARSQSEIITQWQPPLEEHRNGQILGYIIRYRLYGYNNVPWMYQNITNEAQRNYLIQELITWKDYIVQIAAYNNMGVGVYTEGAKIKTKEGVPEAPPTNVKVQAINSTAIKVTWTPPNPQQINGINQGYKIQAWRNQLIDGEEREVEEKMMTVPPSLLDPLAEQSAVLSGLDKFQDYNITVLCFTDPGDGVRSFRIPVKTKEDVPDEITALHFDDVSDRSVTVLWAPPKNINGILTGYTVRHQVKDRPETMKSVNLTAEDTQLVVNQLQATTHYWFEIRAWTRVGGGPPKTATIQSGVEPVLPHPPTNLALSNIEAFSVVLQFTPGFDGNSSITKWKVEAQTARNLTWFTVCEISDPDAETLTVTGLTPFTQYRLRLSATNVVGTSKASEPTKDFQTIQARPMHPPFNVTVRAMSATQLRVRWIPLQQTEWYGNPRGYNITYRQVESDNRITPKSVLIEDHTANSHVLENLEEWTVYEVSMTACNDVGQSRESAIAVERTREAVPSYGPLDVQANATSSTTIVVKWGEVPKQHRNGQIDGYKVFYAATNRGGQVLHKTISNNSSYTTTLTELKKFVIYHIQVLAFTRLGDGALSTPPVRVQTFEDTPGAPSNVSFPDVSFSTARIIWDVPEDPNGEILAYQVTYSLNGTSSLNYSREFSPSDRTFRATQLLAERYYIFSVTAQTRLGWGKTASVLVYTTNNRDRPQPPSMPQISRSQIQAHQITFNWTPGRDGFAPLRYYTVQMRENDGPWTLLPERVDPSLTSYTATNLKPHTTYQFRIQATNDLGPSAFSRESIIVRTLPAAPSVPVTNLKVVPITTTSVRVKWNALETSMWNGDAATGGYRILYQQLSDFPTALQATPKTDVMGINIDSVVLSDLQQDRNYEIVVLPFNSQGPGPATPPAAVYVGEAVPTGEPRAVDAAPISSTEVRLRWKPPKQSMQNGDLLGYKIFYLVTDSPQELEEGKTWEEEIEVVSATATSHSLVFLDKFTEYRIQILAFNPAGDGPRSSPITVKTLQGLPSAPQNLRFEDITMQSLKVSWDPPKFKNGEILGYLVTYETTEENEKFSKQVKQKVSGTSLLVQNLEEQVTYTFTVRAQTIDYGPVVSENVTTGPQDGSPVAPRDLILSKTLSSVEMHWLNGPSGRGPILGYYIEAKKRGGKIKSAFVERGEPSFIYDSRWETITKTTTGTIQDFTVSYQSLLPSTAYTFRVIAYNRYGISFPVYSKDSILTPSKLHLEYGYLQHKPFYRQTWFMVALAATSIVIIIMVIAVLCVKSKSYKYKQEAQKTLEESMAMSIDERQELALELYRSRHGVGTGTLNSVGTLSRGTLGTLGRKNNNRPPNNVQLGKSPPRPSPASVAYHSDEESLKCYDENPDDSSVTEKPSEVSSSEASQHSESENESVRSDPHSFVNHYANVNDSLRQSWKKTKPVRNYSSYTDSEPEGSAVMSLNGGQIIVNNMARSRAPLPGFSSFV